MFGQLLLDLLFLYFFEEFLWCIQVDVLLCHRIGLVLGYLVVGDGLVRRIYLMEVLNHLVWALNFILVVGARIIIVMMLDHLFVRLGVRRGLATSRIGICFFGSICTFIFVSILVDSDVMRCFSALWSFLLGVRVINHPIIIFLVHPPIVSGAAFVVVLHLVLAVHGLGGPLILWAEDAEGEDMEDGAECPSWCLCLRLCKHQRLRVLVLTFLLVLLLRRFLRQGFRRILARLSFAPFRTTLILHNFFHLFDCFQI